MKLPVQFKEPPLPQGSFAQPIEDWAFFALFFALALPFWRRSACRAGPQGRSP
jgi:hypothetical protein